MTGKTVEAAIRDYPDVFARVRAVCTYGAINLDLHAARIVLEIARLKEARGARPCT